MAVRVSNPNSSTLPLPFPFRCVLGPGEGVVLALTLAQVRSGLGPRAEKLFKLTEAVDAVGDDFALGAFGSSALTFQLEAKNDGQLGATYALDLGAAQYHEATLTGPCTITIVAASPAPKGSGHFQLLLKATDVNAVTWANILFTGTGPDLTTAPVWAINIYPDRAGVFRATATPFAS